ncbi:MAG: 50S ribosomal protein L24 [Candidatus Aenigmarchaeota archaeon]|nr:50S ribosomal protein L24 [Candidatus Aenigmarchaeota archaeon]
MYSPDWLSSKQPRKQRKYRFNAPLHRRQKMVAAHLDKALKKELKKRSMPVRVGDEVMIMRGEYLKKTGKVSMVDLKKLKLEIEGIKRKKVSGQEVSVLVDPSNVKIIKIADEARRKKFMKAKKGASAPAASKNLLEASKKSK